MLEIKSVCKTFPGVRALDYVSVTFESGQIHGLLGENGAGKSTLIKIMSGIFSPDSGEIMLDGKPLKLHSYRDAIEKKISIVHQEIQVLPQATIAENIMLDKLKRYKKGIIIDWKKLNSDAKINLDRVELGIDPTTIISGLSAAQKQLCQIARALSSDARILLLDEPTSSITKHEADNLFKLLRKLRVEGVTIVFVSHKLDEVLELCDKITVLRDGKWIATRECANLTKEEIIEMMIGRKTISTWRGLLNIDKTKPVLEVRHLRSDFFEDISLTLYKGEILGLYGLVGSGRTELAKTILGEYKYDSGEIYVNGKPAKIRSVNESLHKYRIGYISENRKEEGLILSYDINSNISITSWKEMARKPFGYIRQKTEREKSKKIVDSLEIKTPSIFQNVNNLSGGNQQKVSIGKWLSAACDTLIIDEPTVGVDVGAKEYIHNLIWRLAKEEGKNIILISSDMPELVSLSRRILVFRELHITGEISEMNERICTFEETCKDIGSLLIKTI